MKFYIVVAVRPFDGETCTEIYRARSRDLAIKRFWREHNDTGLTIVEILDKETGLSVAPVLWIDHPKREEDD